MDCAHCYYPNDDEERFCARCGAAVGLSPEKLPLQAPPAPLDLGSAEIRQLEAMEAAAAQGRAMGTRGVVAPAGAGGEQPLLGGRYRLLRCLGSGGFGSVYEAEDTAIGLRVAVKLLHRAALLDDKLRERFLLEAKMIAELRSPHVVTLYDFAVSPAPAYVPYLVMELLPGVNLASLLLRSVLSPRRTLHILSQVAEALGAAHAMGIVHRDVKPDNIQLLSRPELHIDEDFVKMLDFGVARMCGPMTRPSDILGTPAFISPETLANEPVDGRSDLYSLGMLLWQMTLGELPFPSSNQAVMMSSHLHARRRPPRELYPQLTGFLPTALEDLMTRLVARAPKDRPASAYEVRAELLRLLPLVGDVPLAGARLPNFGPCWDGPLEDHPPPISPDDKPTVRVSRPRRF